ncbi:hypothetical protein F4774DRAFT_342192 [Daldinia eschscholtzii]|nr:hypothetical protein F4774DRAFT_342192 [Daldinia eschscholtzii]
MAESSVISKFISSLTSIQPEASFALGNINLDFTLLKIDAPVEFEGVRNSISKFRKDNAETGDLHRTARKLGALFDDVAPKSPDLLSAYGHRVSEICKKENIDSAERARHGIFSHFIGADSSSVWAAATSGLNAIAVHLLACMIANIFEQAQAVALWLELIEKQKCAVKQTIATETDPMKAVSKEFAVKQVFSREELASWDNSARSWVRTANLATAKQRDVALLYTDQIRAAVNQVTDPYESVMEAWKDAMTSMESLVKGTPQRVRNGAVLLAMSSWHLYPNLCVLSFGPDIIYQNDELVKESGILTVDTEHEGEALGSIIWSLPLSYMRYYGDPVMITEKVAVESARILMGQFPFILAGCIFSTWKSFTPHGSDAIDFIILLSDILQESETTNPRYSQRIRKINAKNSWLGQILGAIRDYKSFGELEQKFAMKLIDHGRRSKDFFCAPEGHPPPLFGLTHIPSLFSLLNGPEACIAYLRQLAQDIGLSNSNCVIRYVLPGDQSYEYATIGPVGETFGQDDTSGYIRCRSTVTQNKAKYARWIVMPTKSKRCDCKGECFRLGAIKKKTRSRFIPVKWTKEVGACPCWERGGCSVGCHDSGSVTAALACGCLNVGPYQSRKNKIESSGEYCLTAHEISDHENPQNGYIKFGNGVDLRTSLNSLSHKSATLSDTGPLVLLDFFAGDHERAAILKVGQAAKEGSQDPRKHHIGFGDNLKDLGRFMPAGTMRKMMQSKYFDYEKLTDWIIFGLRARFPSFIRSLRACAAAAELYDGLPGATVASTIAGTVSLAHARWIPSKDPPNTSPLTLPLSRSEAFACIAMFESGRIVDPSTLKTVFAMALGNSIFVSSPLLCDPYEQSRDAEIRRIPGNIGLPGISFLIPPPEPRIKKPNTDNWTVLDHAPFTGVIQDNFWKTSMHLTHTQYQPELYNLNQDYHYIQEATTLRESLVQVYDNSVWVGDLDILATLKSALLSRVNCSHRVMPNPNTLDSFTDMAIVDHWEELLTPPIDRDVSVVRTSQNWIARLAAVGVAIRRSRPTVILPKTFCWGCVESHIRKLREDGEKDIVLVL